MFSLSCRLSLLCAAGLVGAGTAHAQITTNTQALDSLADAQPPAASRTAATQARQNTPQHPRTQRHVAPRPTSRPQAQTSTPGTTQPAATANAAATRTTP
ncbi:MAG: hypothetical protein L0L41_04080, partial [Acetobacter sp.]|nr:hypothetical protein [Acetobacter sp.]